MRAAHECLTCALHPPTHRSPPLHVHDIICLRYKTMILRMVLPRSQFPRSQFPLLCNTTYSGPLLSSLRHSSYIPIQYLGSWWVNHPDSMSWGSMKGCWHGRAGCRRGAIGV